MLGLDICRDSHYPSASGGYGLLVPSDRAVICSAKPLRSYLLADFIKRYINKLILYILYYNVKLSCSKAPFMVLYPVVCFVSGCSAEIEDNELIIPFDIGNDI